MKELINESINAQIANLRLLESCTYGDDVSKVGVRLIACIKNGGKILFAGNGGSAADAQHFAAELVGRFLKERKALGAIALTTDTSILTSIGNDYGFNDVFARQIEGIGINGDVLFVISTSGNSNNLIKAVEKAKTLGIEVIGLLGKDGGKLYSICDYSIVIPFDFTPRIQETHIFTIHLLCQFIEEYLF